MALSFYITWGLYCCGGVKEKRDESKAGSGDRKRCERCE